MSRGTETEKIVMLWVESLKKTLAYKPGRVVESVLGRFLRFLPIERTAPLISINVSCLAQYVPREAMKEINGWVTSQERLAAAS